MSVGMPSRPSVSAREALAGGSEERSSPPHVRWSLHAERGGEKDESADEASARDIDLDESEVSPRDARECEGDVSGTLSKDLRLGLRERDGYLRQGAGARDVEESKGEEEERIGADNLIGVGQGASIISAKLGGFRLGSTNRVGGRLSLTSALRGGCHTSTSGRRVCSLDRDHRPGTLSGRVSKSEGRPVAASREERAFSGVDISWVSHRGWSSRTGGVRG